MHKFYCVFSSLWMLSAYAAAAVNLSATRVVFEPGKTAASITLSNDAEYPVLVQSWIDDGVPERTPATANSPFIVLPPVFRLAPQAQKSLQLLTSGKTLPQDRESLLWLNVYEIPPTSPSASSFELTLALRSQIKVLWRPVTVGKLPQNIGDNVRFQKKQNRLSAVNPTPWNISFSTISATTCIWSGITLSPFSEQDLPTDCHLQNGEITFSIIDDAGLTQRFRSRIEGV